MLHFDGATYHRAETVRQFIQDMGIQAIIKGPYGYDSMVCELFFSALKATNLNPQFTKTSKK